MLIFFLTTSNYYPGQKNWDNGAHVAQARDLSSMHAPMFGLRACFNFFGQGSMYQRRLQIPPTSSLLMVLYTEISELFCTSFRLALVRFFY